MKGIKNNKANDMCLFQVSEDFKYWQLDYFLFLPSIPL